MPKEQEESELREFLRFCGELLSYGSHMSPREALQLWRSMYPLPETNIEPTFIQDRNPLSQLS